jgi:RNA polymerase sigma-70 factor (ECF subfamily)
MTNERELLLRLINADPEAFKQIFDFYIRQVYQFVYGYIKEKTEAEDITQNVFQKLWEKRSAIDPAKSFSGFLFTIAYRTTIDHLRKNSNKKQWDILEITAGDEPMADLSADYLLNKHQFDSLYEKALQSLTPKRKEIFLLSRHDGLSNKEIAEKLGLSVKTVESHMTAALFSLKEFFKNAEIVVVALLVKNLF